LSQAACTPVSEGKPSEEGSLTTQIELRPSRLGRVALGVGLLTLVFAITAGAALGPAGLPFSGVSSELANRIFRINLGEGLSERQAAILWQIRFPRVVLGALVGGTLALCGAAYQGVFRNPLADPYLLGVASGAGLGATLAIVYGPDSSSWPVGALPVFAFAGALIAVMAAWVVAKGAGPGKNTAILILAGVAVAAFLNAIQTYVQQRQTDSLRSVYAWILGRLSTSGWYEVWLVLPYVVVASVVILLHRRLLDVLSVGEEEASSLGVRTERVRATVIIAATLGTAAVVAVSGLIGFVGIIVPHAIRLAVSTSYKVVLPLSALFGAAFLVLADIAARTVASPAELPIGVITAFFGAPFFVVVLLTSRKGTI